MTKALTLQFMNGFRAYPHFGGKAHTSPSKGMQFPFESGEEGSRNQTTEIGTVYSGWHRNYKLVEYGCTKCEV